MGSSSARSLFGTDGVRGVANRDLTPELALSLGRGLGSRLAPGSTVLIGRDTRRSGAMLEAAIAAGLASAGVNVRLGGVLPTPAVAELVARSDADGGVVISASHNPYPDNGVKIFGADGFKLADTDEAAIEQAIIDDSSARPEAEGIGTITDWPEGRATYIEAIASRFDTDLSSVKVVLDFAHGATVVTANEIFRAVGANVVATIGDAPDGININVACGSTHLDALGARVREVGADLGFAFDGDGDRILAVDHTGAPVDGDQILAVLALRLRDRGELPGNAVVTTSMTNLGFRRAMKAEGVEVRLTDVGDRYVLEEMRTGGYSIGGEQSGHLINLTFGPTGDGVAAALQLLEVVATSGRSLADLAGLVVRLPQKLVNITVADKNALPNAATVWATVAACEAALGDNGRVVVRPSGTEQLVRVMVEAPTDDECEKWCATIAEATRTDLGSGS